MLRARQVERSRKETACNINHARRARMSAPERRAGSLLSQMLRAEICSRSTLSFLTEAHDALSGAIAKRAGFKGLWASGLSIASSLGYRDANEASLHIVDVLKLIDEIAKLAFALGKRMPSTSTAGRIRAPIRRYSSNSAQDQIATLGTPGLAAAERTSRKRAPRGSLADLDLSPRGPRTVRRAQQHQKKRPMSFIASSGSAAS